MSAAVHLDHALARRLLAGDRAEFQALFDSYFPRLYRFALARLRGDADAAQEVVQSVFCKAFERLHTYRGEAALYTWFCQICRNELVDYCRVRAREPASIGLVEDEPAIRAVLESLQAAPGEQPETGAWQRDVQRLVQVALDALPAHYGEVLEWKYVDELPVKEIAARLEMGPKAAESLLTRARTAFHEAFLALCEGREMLTPPSGAG
ncbi:MAG: sigma-70 family RNA polymerase sigma factor [Gammaproteobacteria bacterium]|nr:sigma-70 family RNA polymerase sigma factor [Gammaproteobacteria bacterium]